MVLKFQLYNQNLNNFNKLVKDILEETNSLYMKFKKLKRVTINK
jgi:hypothetical protein